MGNLTIIDTDVLIDAGRSNLIAVAYLQEIELRSTLVISAITQMELMIGCQNKTELRAVNRFLSRFKILKLTDAISDIAVELIRQYRLSHGLLIADALIAATALATNDAFVTKNQRDFRYIAGLNLLAFPG